MPTTIYNLFSAEYSNYVMNTKVCFEIYFDKFPMHQLIENNFDEIISESDLYEDDQIFNYPLNKKIECFYLTNFYNKSNLFFIDLKNEYDKNPKNDKIVSIIKIVDLFMLANKEFSFNLNSTLEIFKNNFKFIDGKTIDLWASECTKHLLK